MLRQKKMDGQEKEEDDGGESKAEKKGKWLFYIPYFLFYFLNYKSITHKLYSKLFKTLISSLFI